MSGVDSCAAPVQYKGPDAPKASVSGTCTDKAANTSPPASFDLRYDTKPPILGRLKAEITSRGVVLKWTASKDTHSIAVVRRPGLRGRKLSTLYNGKARTFTDRRLKSGRQVPVHGDCVRRGRERCREGPGYKAEPLDDEAGGDKARRDEAAANSTKTALTKPAAGARLTVPPLLAWGASPRRRTTTFSSTGTGRRSSPSGRSTRPLRLQRSWRFDGRNYA